MVTKTERRIKGRIIEALHTRLPAWYAKNCRDLPWRRARDPYAILVSEFMLQQTRVATVIPYYERWMRAFPTVESLARGRTERVLRLWAGLGYYSRARHLHAAARTIVTKHEGRIPSDLEALQALPGVGRYTAGAVASIGFNRPAPILDGNVIRVLSRLFLIREDTARKEVRDTLWRLAGEIIPRGCARDFNQALMELGALLCLPGWPVCAACPINRVCVARLRGKAAEIPVLRERPATQNVTEYALILRRNGRVLLRQRHARELMTGLWGFPRFHNEEKMRRQYKLARTRRLGEITHSVMNRRITVKAVMASANGSELDHDVSSRWVRLAGLHQFALPAADKRLADLLRRGRSTQS